MQQLPLFHTIAGQPVAVLGDGEEADAKRRLVERAGGVVVPELQRAIDEGARLAFVAHDDPAMCEADALRLRCAGLLVNVVDRPELCDFTTPSILDRDPVLVAVGTGGASAGLAKQLRLRLERLLPANLGSLAGKLFDARERLRTMFPDMRERRAALDAALTESGTLDPFDAMAAERVEEWLAAPGAMPSDMVHTITLNSDDPDDLTLGQARLLGAADTVIFDPAVAPAILDRARADAVRVPAPHEATESQGLVIIIERAGSKIIT